MKALTEAAKKRLTATIANTILRVDVGVGLLLDELKSAGFAENTLVVFLGDNGLPIQRVKTTSYEAGVRVPLVVRWPGVAQAGQVRPKLVSEVDLLPTLLSAAGVSAPSVLAGQPLQDVLLTASSPSHSPLGDGIEYSVRLWPLALGLPRNTPRRQKEPLVCLSKAVILVKH